jgi:pyruvate,water dikinase
MTIDLPHESWDVLHEDIGPTALWTRANIAEACPGVPTPLTWSWFGPGSDIGVSSAWVRMGVLPAHRSKRQAVVGDRMLAIYAGHAVLNLGVLREIGDSIPGSSGNRVEEQLFSTEAVTEPVRPHRGRYPLVMAKLLPAVIDARRQLLREQPRSRAWWRDSIATLSDPQCSAATARAKLTESFEHYCPLVRGQTINSIAIPGLYDLLTRVCDRYGLADQVGALTTSDDLTPEAVTVRDLWRLSRDEIDLDAFLALHGYHSPVQGELAAPSWRAEPKPVLKLLETYRLRSVDDSPEAAHHRLRAERDAAEAALLRALPAPGRPAVRRLLRLVRAMVPLREVARLQFLQCADVARAAATVVGARMAAEGRLASVEDVFYLTMDELTGDQTIEPDLVQRRRDRAEFYAGLDVPTRFRGYPEVTVTAPPDDSGRVLTGISGSRGVHVGTARVIAEPGDADDLADGEILVCETTNPTWASYFLVAGAVVIDIGGPLSHGPIVAREMGIPCVVNTRNARHVIRSGDTLRVDGTAGVVEILT